MVEAFMKFNRGLFKFSIGVQLWLALLVLVNFIIPIFYVPRIEALVSIVVFMAGFALMLLITNLSGFTRLLGLGHILWLPMILFMWSRLDPGATGERYYQWILTLMILDAISLVIDAVDVVRFMKGEREEIVLGL
jgi:hypothetical protein